MRVYRQDLSYPYGRFGTTRLTLLAWPILLLSAALIGFLLSLVAESVPATGQIVAVGLNEAWRRYHGAWLTTGLTGAIGMMGLLVSAAIIDRIIVWWHSRDREKWLLVLLSLVFVTLVSSLWLVARDAYQKARNDKSSQVSILPGAVRSWIVRTVADESADRATLGQRERDAASLSKQLAATQDRLTRLRLLLAGSEPVTKLDLQIAEENGRIEGFLFGILSSLIASYIFSWLKHSDGPRERRLT